MVAIATSSFGLGGPTLLSRFIPATDPEQRAGLAYTLVRRLAGLRIVQVLGLALVGAVLAVFAPAEAPPLVIGLVVLAITLDFGATLAFQTTLAFGRASLWSLLAYPFNPAGRHFGLARATGRRLRTDPLFPARAVSRTVLRRWNVYMRLPYSRA